MKKVVKMVMIAGFFMAIPLFHDAQNPPHPNGGNVPGTGNTPVGGGAPIGNGLILLATLGLGFAARKVYNAKHK